ncbi:splicing factor U2AF 35 kDa subunit-like isoform X1 [Octopus vulgaris]|uniref:Splicing factor U2AF 35 kDa subunit-like isoform X1 n=1 Tax=Octopus vulgaris TaxID=6645 RepID=A0AA36AW33_OCTVU|nr:splicing factor U2AF 35 kDa subunit-like isoform X1 [Octopus vulgaris]
MAEYLASIFGTEKDKVNCSFYFKIGACRHGERCSRLHNKPTFSQTVLLQNLYLNPQNAALTADGSHIPEEKAELCEIHTERNQAYKKKVQPNEFGVTVIEMQVTMDDVEAQQDFDDFFEEVFCEIEDKINIGLFDQFEWK